MKKIHSFLLIVFCLAIILQACEKEPAPELTVSATQLTIEYGTTATISWAAINATACSSDAGNITGVNGSVTTPPLTKTTTYSFTATGPGGTVTATIIIQVKPEPVVVASAYASSYDIAYDGTTEIFWTSTNVDSITLNGFLVSSLNGSKKIDSLKNDTTFVFRFFVKNVEKEKDIVDIRVASPPIIIIPTRTDTICGRYWMVISSKSFFDNEWVTWKLDEDKLTRKWYFYKRGFHEIFKKNGDLVGNGYWNFVGQDSINISNSVQRISLTDTTMTMSSTYISDGKIVTSVGVWRGYKITPIPN